jgi:hypothetical protein
MHLNKIAKSLLQENTILGLYELLALLVISWLS